MAATQWEKSASPPESPESPERVAPKHRESSPADSTYDRNETSKKTEGKSDDGGFKNFVRIFTYARPIDYLIEAVALLAALGSGVAVALTNLVMGQFISILTRYISGVTTADEFRSQVSRQSLFFVYIGIARLVLTYGYASLSTFSAYHITRNIRHAYVHAALSQEVAYFDHGTGGSVSMQATSNGKLIQSGIAEKLGMLFVSISTFVTAFIIAFVSQWKLTLILSCVAPTLVVVIGGVVALDGAIDVKILRVLAQAGSFAETVLASVRNVHAFGLRPRLVRRFDVYLDEARRLGNKKGKLYGVMFSGEYTIIYLGIGLAFWQGVRMMLSGEVADIGVIFTVIMSVMIATLSLTMLAPSAVAFGKAASAAGELFTLIDRTSEINPFDESGEKPTDTKGVIDIEGITFAYPTRPGVKVLEDFSLHVPAGKVTALVGASGSGKSTIIGLLERWYNPASGTIKLDGRPTDQLNLNWLRTNIRLVQQEPVLFNGTVFENIANGLVGTSLENATPAEQQKRVEEAAKIAFAHDFVSELPEGYQTRIGERGGLLSGGQKQRIAIARSIVSEPKVLLLDEATSALDPQAEGIVQHALDNASRSRTTIVIAHKLATIRDADNIVVMSHGKIMEHGTHDDLVSREGSVYSRLVKAQNLAGATDAKQNKGASSSSLGDDDDDDDDEGEEGGANAVPKEEVRPTNSIVRYQTAERQHLESLRHREDFDKYQQTGFFRTITRLVLESKELTWVYVAIVFCCAAGGALLPAQAIIFGRVMDIFQAEPGEMERRGNFFAAMFIALAGAAFSVYFTMGWMTNIVAQVLSQKVRRRILDGFLRQDLQFFDRAENTVGALTARLDSLPQSVLELMGFNIALMLIAAFTVVGSTILALVTSWKLGLVGVSASMPPMLLAGYARIRLETRMDAVTDKRFGASASLASEAILAIRTVSSLATERSVLRRYAKELDRATAQSSPPMFHMMIWFAFTQAIEYFILALGFWYGCRLVSFGEVTFYQFFISFMGVFFAGQSAGQLFSFSSSFTKALYAANYYFWLQSLVPTVQETPENRLKAPKSDVQSIELQSVRFQYPLRPDNQVLRGVSLEIQPGQFVAFVGASGCGKSTMMALLERFYDPSKGGIRIDGADDLRDLNPRLYRRHVSLVQQEPTLYPGSIRENVAFGVDSTTTAAAEGQPRQQNQREEEEADPQVTDAQVEAALRAANAWDFVCSLPEGVNTACGTSGSQLSGGQRQRIAIARALVRAPRVLLLDEATSALDTESEKVVQSALAEAARARGRLTVAVAHRLSTIRDADLICVFYGGRVEEVGTHEELLALGGMYRKMCEAQSLDRKV